jgi:hypothetical protein
MPFLYDCSYTNQYEVRHLRYGRVIMNAVAVCFACALGGGA